MTHVQVPGVRHGLRLREQPYRRGRDAERPADALCGSGPAPHRNPTGGTGLTYQWYDGGSTISGATSSTSTANATGTHSYNCKVTGSGCGSGRLDAPRPRSPGRRGPPSPAWPRSPTRTAPPADSTSPGAPRRTPCPGGVTYAVYRSTTTPVSPVAGNLIASGLSYHPIATGHLINGTTYYYLVRAANVSNGIEDTNAVEKCGVPCGPSRSRPSPTPSRGRSPAGASTWPAGPTPPSPVPRTGPGPRRRSTTGRIPGSRGQDHRHPHALVSPSFGVVASRLSASTTPTSSKGPAPATTAARWSSQPTAGRRGPWSPTPTSPPACSTARCQWLQQPHRRQARLVLRDRGRHDPGGRLNLGGDANLREQDRSGAVARGQRLLPRPPAGTWTTWSSPTSAPPARAPPVPGLPGEVTPGDTSARPSPGPTRTPTVGRPPGPLPTPSTGASTRTCLTSSTRRPILHQVHGRHDQHSRRRRRPDGRHRTLLLVPGDRVQRRRRRPRGQRHRRRENRESLRSLLPRNGRVSWPHAGVNRPAPPRPPTRRDGASRHLRHAHPRARSPPRTEETSSSTTVTWTSWAGRATSTRRSSRRTSSRTRGRKGSQDRDPLRRNGRGPPAVARGGSARRPGGPGYYTASKFNTDEPGRRDPHGAPAPALQRPPRHLPPLQPRRHPGRGLRHHRHEGVEEPRRGGGGAQDPHLREHPRGREGRAHGRLRRARHHPRRLHRRAAGRHGEEARGRVGDVVHPHGEPLRQRPQHAVQQQQRGPEPELLGPRGLGRASRLVREGDPGHPGPHGDGHRRPPQEAVHHLPLLPRRRDLLQLRLELHVHARPTDEPIFWSSRTGGSGCGGQTMPTLAPNGLAEGLPGRVHDERVLVHRGLRLVQHQGGHQRLVLRRSGADLDTTIEVTATKTPARRPDPHLLRPSTGRPSSTTC